MTPVPKPVRQEKRRKGLRRRNEDRHAKMRARNFPTPELVEPGCLVARELDKYRRKHGAKMWPAGWTPCWGRVDPAHVTPRGMGGCNSDAEDVVRLCQGHHREQEGQTAEFEARYCLNLKAEAAAYAERRAAGADDGGP